MVLEQLGVHIELKQKKPLLIPHCSKVINVSETLNVKSDSMKFLEENISVFLR